MNLNPAGKGLKQRVLHDQAVLIAVFEEMFGHNKAPAYDQHNAASQGRQRLGDMLDYKSQQALRNSMANLSNYNS